MQSKHHSHCHVPTHTEPRLRKYYQINYEKLQFIRWSALIFYAINQLIAMSQYSIAHSCLFSIAYLTNWGYLLCFLFTYILLSTRADQSLTNRMGHVFHILLSMQFLITAFYWAVIYPTTVHENFVVLYIDYVKHIFPMVHMFVEFLFNNIVFDRTSIRRFKIFILSYLATNFTLVRWFEFEIYSMITWRG
jgi:hypothetical protein